MKKNLNELLSIVCNYVKVSESEVKSKSRKHNIVTARHLFCYYASIIGNESYMDSCDLVGLEYTNIYDIREKINKKIAAGDREICSLMRKIDIKLERIEPESNPIPTLSESLKKNKYIIGIDIASNEESFGVVSKIKLTSGGTRILSNEIVSLKKVSEKDRKIIDKAFKILQNL